jgi:hypothetical protein
MMTSRLAMVAETGLPDFFGKVFQNGGKYTKLPQNVTDGHKIYIMDVK